jgi:hypothetical protein
MEAVARIELETSIKETILTTLGELVSHNVKGADLIKKGIEQAFAVTDDIKAWYDTLVTLINILKPLFEVAREWLVDAYNHLVAVFDWAKEMWHKIFGHKQVPVA